MASMQPIGDDLPPPAARPRARFAKWLVPMPVILLGAGCLLWWLVKERGQQAQRQALEEAEADSSVVRGASPRDPVDPGLVLLDPLEVAAIPTARKWSHPLGAENGSFSYNAQPFLTTRHLGDDLNGIGGWNTDLGDAVYAAARGRVLFAGEGTEGWGKMVILGHRLAVDDPAQETDASASGIVESVYAHLDQIDVHVGDTLHRGEPLGSVGTAGGRYLAHLHFEIRASRAPDPGVGYFDTALRRSSPQKWISDRSLPPDQLSPAPESVVGEQDLRTRIAPAPTIR